MPKSGNLTKTVLTAGLITILIFLRALWCDFVNFDDPGFVINNTIIRSLDWNLIVKAFGQQYVDFWLPLVWLSYALDFHLWGLNPFGYHLTNILLHTVNTGLVVLITGRIFLTQGTKINGQGRTFYPALLLAGLLWGIHPLRVESVVWITERKDVLNGVFSLGAIYYYLRYAEKCSSGSKEKLPSREYLMSLVFFAFSLMAKPISVVIPAMMLVIDWYPLDRFHRGEIWKLLAEKVPFFVLSLLVTILTILFAAEGQLLTPFGQFPLSQRLLVSGNAVFDYCRLLIWPQGILPYYIIPAPLPSSYAVKTVIVVIFTGYCFFVARQRPAIAAIWLLFVIPLLPVLAFLQNGGEQSMAARFTYLPSVAPGIAATLLFVHITRVLPALSRTIKVVAVLLLFVYAGMTIRLTGVWQDTGTLWSRVIEHRPLGRAYLERGMYLFTAGNYRGAVDDLTTAIGIAEKSGIPGMYNLYAFRGEALRQSGRYENAVQDYSAAIALWPDKSYYLARGTALMALGKTVEAQEDLLRAGDAGPVVWHKDKQLE